MQPQDLDLNYIAPTVTADGNVVLISTGSNIPTLIFFQVRKQSGDQLSADAVASVRMNSIEDLKNLQTAIEDTIKRHGAKEP